MDFDETFSPVISHIALRMVLTLANQRGWVFLSYDVIIAYLNSPLDGPIYMDQIEGYIDANHPNHVLLLRQALYGLKQAA